MQMQVISGAEEKHHMTRRCGVVDKQKEGVGNLPERKNLDSIKFQHAFGNGVARNKESFVIIQADCFAGQSPSMLC